MSNLQILTDAFAELERRADAATATQPHDQVLPATRHRRTDVLLVAASIGGVLAIAGGVLAFARGGGSHPAAGGRPVTHTHQSPGGTEPFHFPGTPDELADRFRAVLGGTATFTVTGGGAAGPPIRVTLSEAAGHHKRATATPMSASGESFGAAIRGTLTASGMTGGFDLAVVRAGTADTAQCEDYDGHCTIRTLADGSSLAVHVMPLAGPAHGVTYSVELLRPDRVEFLMHVSNERDPKGESKILAPAPPLTSRQMVDIVTSDRW